MLAEYGYVLPKGIAQISKRVPTIIENGQNELPGCFRLLMQRLVEHLKELGRQVGELTLEIQRWHRENAASQKLSKIPGLGPISATALAASVGDARSFKNGRQLAAWLGIVPRPHSSGGKPTLLGISKRGDCYLRTLLIHGARAVIKAAEHRADTDPWIKRLIARRNKNIATVALANKNARTIWALLARDREYEPSYRMMS